MDWRSGRLAWVRIVVVGVFWPWLAAASASGQPVLEGPALDPRSLTPDLPFPMANVALPRIPPRTVRITDHGARGDGR